MHKISAAGRKPKVDGSKGWIITYDPEHKSFKQSFITIVFTGMWLEALMHILIMRKFGKGKFKEYDFKSYEEKLRLLGCLEQEILEKVTRFRKSRKELVHEKAYCDNGIIKIAQNEADNAHELLVAVDKYFSTQLR